MTCRRTGGAASLLLLTINNIFERTGKLKQRYTKDHLIEASELVHSEKDKDFINKLLYPFFQDKEIAVFTMRWGYIGRRNLKKTDIYPIQLGRPL